MPAYLCQVYFKIALCHSSYAAGTGKQGSAIGPLCIFSALVVICNHIWLTPYTPLLFLLLQSRQNKTVCVGTSFSFSQLSSFPFPVEMWIFTYLFFFFKELPSVILEAYKHWRHIAYVLYFWKFLLSLWFEGIFTGYRVPRCSFYFFQHFPFSWNLG